jgi:hypothetical protein
MTAGGGIPVAAFVGAVAEAAAPASSMGGEAAYP